MRSVLLTLVLAGVAFAAPVVYLGLDTANVATNSEAVRLVFFAHLTGVATDSLESYEPGDGAPLALSFGVYGDATLNSGTYNAVTAFSDVPGGGSRMLRADPPGWDVTFEGPVSAFGFYLSDLFSGGFGTGGGGDLNRLIITLYRAGGGADVLTIKPEDYGVNKGDAVYFAYFGFLDWSTRYTKVAFEQYDPMASDRSNVDLLTVGKPIPEPAPAFLVGAALAGLSLRRGRR